MVNRRSGLFWPLGAIQEAIDTAWDAPGTDLVYQFTRSRDDGAAKARLAVAQGVDTIIAIGGDGTVNAIGGCLVGTTTALAAIPVGSGNGFARHFNIPLRPEDAPRALAPGVRTRIDVGRADGHAFFVTCSLAWDAALVQTFDQSPVRGILPYVFAAVYRLFDYRPQPMTAEIDGREERFSAPLLFTVANLTQYGGGAVIAPTARADDGLLELVVVEREHFPRLIGHLPNLFNGTIDSLPEVRHWRFRHLRVHRDRADPIQIDGELLAAGPDVEIEVTPRALDVIVPNA